LVGLKFLGEEGTDPLKPSGLLGNFRQENFWWLTKALCQVGDEQIGQTIGKFLASFGSQNPFRLQKPCNLPLRLFSDLPVNGLFLYSPQIFGQFPLHPLKPLTGFVRLAEERQALTQGCSRGFLKAIVDDVQSGVEGGFLEGCIPVADIGRTGAVAVEEDGDDGTEEAAEEFIGTVADDAAKGIADEKSADREQVHALSPLAKGRVNGVKNYSASDGSAARTCLRCQQLRPKTDKKMTTKKAKATRCQFIAITDLA